MHKSSILTLRIIPNMKTMKSSPSMPVQYPICHTGYNIQYPEYCDVSCTLYLESVGAGLRLGRAAEVWWGPGVLPPTATTQQHSTSVSSRQLGVLEESGERKSLESSEVRRHGHWSLVFISPAAGRCPPAPPPCACRGRGPAPACAAAAGPAGAGGRGRCPAGGGCGWCRAAAGGGCGRHSAAAPPRPCPAHWGRGWALCWAGRVWCWGRRGSGNWAGLTNTAQRKCYY